jgi:hypothetical protein
MIWMLKVCSNTEIKYMGRDCDVSLDGADAALQTYLPRSRRLLSSMRWINSKYMWGDEQRPHDEMTISPLEKAFP